MGELACIYEALRHERGSGRRQGPIHLILVLAAAFSVGFSVGVNW